ncbi:hypothetical protein [Sodalis glossinidius]|uniref:hypothetical protein n=1 Tax=Sodalis glossinidius TaxID=63612 RepID=UPI001305431E|nr:hypothetical protein [Sodalis glossinidius]
MRLLAYLRSPSYWRSAWLLGISLLCMTSMFATAPVAAEPQTVLRVGVASRLGQDLWFRVSGEDQHLPYTLQWVNFDAAPPAMDALLADSIDTFWGGDTPAVFLS